MKSIAIAAGIALIPLTSFGQAFIGGGSEEQTYLFPVGGRDMELALCESEICRLEESGKVRLERIQGGLDAAIGMAAEAGKNNYLVFYRPGQMGEDDARLILRNRYLIKLRPGADLEDVQARCGILHAELKFPTRGLVVCEEESTAKVLSQMAVVARDPAVELVEPLFARPRAPRAVPTDPLYPDQWYLNDDAVVPPLDINVEDAWDSYTGAGVTVGVVDTGIYSAHEDLANNIDVTIDYNWTGDGPADDGNPTSDELPQPHGTWIAGLIGMEWNNGVGGSGVAPEVQMTSLRLLPPGGGPGTFAPQDDADEAEAQGWMPDVIDIYNNSWGPFFLFNTAFDGPGLLTQAALEDGVMTGRGGLGSIYVWSGGNNGSMNGNSNYDGYANSPFTIAVGAIDDTGDRALYSSPGANLNVVAPSIGGTQEVISTSYTFDPDPDEGEEPFASTYSNADLFLGASGTSNSAALVTGVVALMLEANPDLNWRDVQEILMTTASQVDPVDPDWIENAAGLTFNHQYGAGLVDASAAVAAAETWTSLGDRTEQFVSKVPVQAIPDADGNSYVITFDFADMPNLRVEHVQLQTTIIHTHRSDLDITLISPNGTQSVLHETHPNSFDQSIGNWFFSTVRNWGEGSAGTWVLRVTDSVSGNSGVFNNAILRIYGVEDPDAPVSQAPLVISNKLVMGMEGAPLEYRLETLGADTLTLGTLPAGLAYDELTGIISGAPEEPGVFGVDVTLTGPIESNVETLVFSIEPLAFSLGGGVEQDDLPTFTRGDAPWTFEFVETNDGEDSLGSAPGLLDNQSSTFGFAKIPTGVVMFDWRTSSQQGDRLWFSRSGTQPPQVWEAFIDGIREWGTVAVPMPNDNGNDLFWVYTKDVMGALGSDRGFVDQVRFMDTPTYMEKLIEAASIDFDFEMTSRTWWYPSEDLTRPDGQAIAASSIGNGQRVSLAAWAEGPAELSFNFRVDTEEDFDFLEILLNSVVFQSYSGSEDWTASTLELPEGLNYIEIRYRKDNTVSAGEDTVFLDDLSIVPMLGFGTFAAGAFDPADMHNPLIGSPEANPDDDEYSNLAEYAFHGNAMVADIPPYAPKLVQEGGSNFIEFGLDKRMTDLEFEVQESDDLDSWSRSFRAVKVRAEGYVDVYRIPIFQHAVPAELFFRVKMTLVP